MNGRHGCVPGPSADAEVVAAAAAAAASAKTSREAAEAVRIQAEEAKTEADSAAAVAAQASANAAAAAAQAKVKTDAAAAAQAKAEAEAEAAADLDAAAAEAKANIEAKAKAEAETERGSGSVGSANGAGSAGSDNGGSGGNGGYCVDSNDGDDIIATMDDATRIKLLALNITVHVLFRHNLVRIQMSGPSHKWIGVSFGATVMAENPYAIVWEVNKVSERLLREYSAGLILKNSSMTYIESCYKTNPLRYSAENQPIQSSDMSIRKNTCMRPIVVVSGGSNDTTSVDTYYSFAKLKEYGGDVNFMLALGHTKSFGYHSNIFTGVLTFPPPPPGGRKPPTVDESSFAKSTWIVVLVIVVIILIAVISWKCCKLYDNKRSPSSNIATLKRFVSKKTNTKDLPAVATVDIEMSTNSAASKIAKTSLLDDFRSNHQIDHQVVEMSASLNPETAAKSTNHFNDFRSSHQIDHQVIAVAKNTVDTMFGAGTVANTRDNGTQTILLNDWKLAGNNVAVMYLPRSQEKDSVATQLSVSRRKKSLKRGGSSGASPTMLCLLCLFSILYKGSLFCNAHNWLNNPVSRASKTSTVTPCPPADLSRPAHMQVGMDQDFEVEFMSGHSYTNTYFAIIRHEDERQLKYHSQSMFEKYIANAPEGATIPAPERTHVSLFSTLALFVLFLLFLFVGLFVYLFACYYFLTNIFFPNYFPPQLGWMQQDRCILWLGKNARTY
jgi:hypothetical protein